MIAIEINGEIKTYPKIPSQWNGIFNYNKATYRHFDDGWRDVIIPSYNSNTEKLGSLKVDGDTITYEVIPLTESELKLRISSNAEVQKEQAIQDKLKKQIVDEFQGIEDESELLENSFMFPFWEVGIPVEANQKYQAFDGLELKLYRVVQAHTTQEGWEPPITPALFARVALPDEILPWVQPTGAHDSYQLGDRVTHNGQTWESTHNGANSWEPGVYGWKEI